MMLARLGRVVYIAAVLFAVLIWAVCVIESLIDLAKGGTPDWLTIAMLALFALLVALVGRAICYVFAGE